MIKSRRERPGLAGKKRKGNEAFSKRKDASSASKSQPVKLSCEPRPDWHATELSEISYNGNPKPIPPQLLEIFHNHAHALLEAEASAYAAEHFDSSSSHRFLSTIMHSGTWGDKVSALTLLVQESPLHTLKPFDNLLGIAAKRSRTQAIMAVGALKDLLAQGVILPQDRKLRSFGKNPSVLAALQGLPNSWSPEAKLPRNVDNAHLIHWAYEDWLKRKYFELLKIIETWSNDEVEFSRMRAATFVWELLKEKPEQEENLLRLLVNKLGDSSKKVASRTSYLLLQLQTLHPAMKNIIVEAIESELLLRPGQSFHSKYYAVITLNQTVLHIADPNVANKLLDIYFGMFVAVLNKSRGGIKKRNEKNGLKRNLVPKNKKYSNENSTEEQEVDDKIVAQVLTGVNRAVPFSTKEGHTFEAHLDTLFKIAHSSNFNTVIQAMLLIQQMSVNSHTSIDRFYRMLYESLLDPRLIRSSKHTLYLNLLYKSLKADTSIKRVKAFVKRILQILPLHDPPFICAAIYLVAELEVISPSIKALLNQPETLDDESNYAVLDDKTDGNELVNGQSTAHPSRNAYDGRKRDPRHSNADRSCLWELAPWPLHFHPSVSLFASQLLYSRNMPEKPDPSLHSLIQFLDRFSYRNAKTKTDGTRGSSIMQPALAGETTDTLISARNIGRLEQPLNSEAFWKKQGSEIPADEVFFHTYFNQRLKSKDDAEDSKKPKKSIDGEQLPNEDDDEDEIWNALTGSRPEIEDDESGSDDELDVEYLSSEDEDIREEDSPMLDDLSDGSLPGGEREQSDVGSDDGEVMVHEADENIDIDEEVRVEPEKSGDNKRRKLKDLPTFASVEDYADMLENELSEDGMND